jgi:signal transduction histidine kinase
VLAYLTARLCLLQVLNNLLGNAAKFTRQGTIRVSASWHDSQHQWVAVHVTDTGVGIPKHKLASIFLPFEQVRLLSSATVYYTVVSMLTA